MNKLLNFDWTRQVVKRRPQKTISSHWEISLWSIFIMLLCFPLLLTSQQITISEEIPVFNDVSYEIIGELAGQTLLFRDRTTHVEVQGFNRQLHLSWEKVLELDKRNPKTMGITASKFDFTLFYYFKNKGKTILKAHKYDPAANLRDSVTIKELSAYAFTPEFEIIQSQDKSKVLIYYLERQEAFQMLCFDVDSMKLMWEKSFSPENYYREQHFAQILLSNDGKMFMVRSKDNFFSRRKDHYYLVYHYDGSQEEVSEIKIPLKDILTYDVWFSVDDLNRRLLGGGLYSDKNREKAIGYFYLNLDPETPENYLVHYEPFDNEFMARFMDKKPKKNVGITEAELRESVIRRDGGILMFVEKVKEFTRTSSNYPRASRIPDGDFRQPSRDMYYDNIMVLSIHPSGKLHWKTILYKKQYSQNDQGAYSSYFSFKTAENIKLLFNDEIKQENTISEYIIDGLGHADRNSVMNTENLELRLRFREGLQLDSKRFLVPSERRSRLKLVRFEY
ncbi:MAG: hypothetical protein KDC85_08850 [Saprospiraceae bacterium]|nr:hypothetical protein [Saprospiraceae bacterium]MCB9324769.1 hypothetical protein [Lewinellaceae bacterium]